MIPAVLWLVSKMERVEPEVEVSGRGRKKTPTIADTFDLPNPILVYEKRKSIGAIDAPKRMQCRLDNKIYDLVINEEEGGSYLLSEYKKEINKKFDASVAEMAQYVRALKTDYDRKMKELFSFKRGFPLGFDELKDGWLQCYDGNYVYVFVPYRYEVRGITYMVRNRQHVYKLKTPMPPRDVYYKFALLYSYERNSFTVINVDILDKATFKPLPYQFHRTSTEICVGELNISNTYIELLMHAKNDYIQALRVLCNVVSLAQSTPNIDGLARHEGERGVKVSPKIKEVFSAVSGLANIRGSSGFKEALNALVVPHSGKRGTRKKNDEEGIEENEKPSDDDIREVRL
jgi:hypothetical protein